MLLAYFAGGLCDTKEKSQQKRSIGHGVGWGGDSLGLGLGVGLGSYAPAYGGSVVSGECCGYFDRPMLL